MYDCVSYSVSEAGSLFQFWKSGAGLYKIILLAARVTAVYNELVRLPFVCFTHPIHIIYLVLRMMKRKKRILLLSVKKGRYHVLSKFKKITMLYFPLDDWNLNFLCYRPTRFEFTPHLDVPASGRDVTMETRFLPPPNLPTKI